jgi:hypothetical protein
MSLSRLAHRGSLWDIHVQDRGGAWAECRVDGTPLCGSMKVPARYHDGKRHTLEVMYSAKKPVPCFTEIVNAEVIAAEGDSSEARVTIRGLGTVDIAFPAEHPVELQVDGAVVPFQRAGGTGYVQIPQAGEHTLVLRDER